MTTIPDMILIACLDALENGESAAQIAARYPDYAEGLRPFLDTAILLQELPPAPPEVAVALSKKVFLQEAEEMKGAALPQPRRRSWFQVLRPFLALAMVLIAFGVTIAAASASALPGDTLYSTKRFIENARLSRTNDPAARETLLNSFEQERVREINSLLQAGRAAAVNFSGQVEAIAGTQWIINGVQVKITPETQITGTVLEGAEAAVTGRVEDGMFTAAAITLPEIEPPSSEAEPTATSLPPTETAVPPTAAANTPTATPSAAPTATPTPSGTPSPTPSPTVIKNTPSPSPTADLNNNNENEGENENENESGSSDNENDNGGHDNSNSNDDDDNDNNDNDNGSDDNSNSNDSDNDNDNSNDNDDDDSNNNDDDDDDDDNRNDDDSNHNDDSNGNDNDDDDSNSNDDDDDDDDDDDNDND